MADYDSQIANARDRHAADQKKRAGNRELKKQLIIDTAKRIMDDIAAQSNAGDLKGRVHVVETVVAGSERIGMRLDDNKNRLSYLFSGRVEYDRMHDADDFDVPAPTRIVAQLKIVARSLGDSSGSGMPSKELHENVELGPDSIFSFDLQRLLIDAANLYYS